MVIRCWPWYDQSGIKAVSINPEELIVNIEANSGEGVEPSSELLFTGVVVIEYVL
jgi:hypothetical protein